jgi:SAM-dependent methyltransferase
MNGARFAALFVATSMPDRDWWQALWPNPTTTLRKLGVLPTMTVVDLCCGDGYFTAPLSQLVEGRLIAVDADPAMIERARLEVERQRAPAPHWVCGDAMRLADHVPTPVDMVLLANTLHGVEDRAALMRQIAAVLRPTGLLAVVNWHRRPRDETTVLGRPRGPATDLRMTPEQTRVELARAGFDLQKVLELPPYHYGVIAHSSSPAAGSVIGTVAL